MVNHRRQAIGVFLLIEIPVAERRPVVVAPFKPAVVNDKSLDAQRRRLIRHAHDVLRIMVEVNPFPGIEMHRSRLIVRKTNDLLTQIAVELLAHTVQPLSGIAGIEAGCPQRFPFRERHFARQIQGFRLQVAAAVGFHLRPQTVVTAPAQMHAPDLSLHFAKRRATGNQRREMFMGGASTAIFQHKTIVFESQTMRLKFANPAAVERHNFAGTLGNR